MAMVTKSFNTPDETRKPSDKTKIEVVKLGDKEVLKTTFSPGWRWSTDIKPVAKTDLCGVHHMGYQVSGKMHIKLSDGQEVEIGPDDVADIPPGHDAWVVGDEPVVLIDFTGAGYGK